MGVDPLREGSALPRLILVGNPNVGKSLLFNLLTRRYVTVSNYPGTTVEITRTIAAIEATPTEIIDTPGTNSLLPQSDEERVTRDLILDSTGARILQVGDAKNLRRTLLLSLQLIECGLPITVGLNMTDEAHNAGIRVDTEQLSEILDVEVIPISALRRWNIDWLRGAAARPGGYLLRYTADIEDALSRVMDLLPAALPVHQRAIAIALLCGDSGLADRLNLHGESWWKIDRLRRELERTLGEPVAYTINRARLAAADTILAQVVRVESHSSAGAREWLGRMSMHPFWGLVVLALVLWAAWWLVGQIGAGMLVDLLEERVFNRGVNPVAIVLVDAVAPFPHLHQTSDGALTSAYTLTGVLGPFSRAAQLIHDLLVGPYGVITMAITYAIAIVLPVVITFFIFFGLLEDSGYLSRLAVMLNRIFRRMGLNGKAVLPMVLGLGCDTMATLTTRILETRKEAIIVTLLLALGVPCSAQLGVIMAMLAPLGLSALMIWLGVVVGTIFLVGWLAAQIIPGERAELVLEIPPIRMPRISNIAVKVLARAEWYLREAVPLFVAGTVLLYLLDVTGGLVIAQRMISPLVVGILQLPAEAANAFLIGFLRRDYGAAGLFMLQRQGSLNATQTLVSLTVITLLIPCVANFLMIVKERGMKIALGMAAFILVYAFGIGWALRVVLS